MKTVYTVEALSDIDGILNWLGHHYPTVAPAVSQRIEQVVARIAAWPGSARLVSSRPGVHAVPLGRYPYLIFDRVEADTVEILHVYHTAQRLPG